MYRVKGNGLHYTMNVYAQQPDIWAVGQRVTFRHEANAIVAYVEHARVGEVKDVKEGNVIRHILQHALPYYASIQAFHQQTIAVELVRPITIERARETIAINTSQMQALHQQRYEAVMLPLYEQPLVYIAHHEKNGKYYLFGGTEHKPTVLILKWEQDQLFAEAEEPITYKPDEKEKLLRSAKVFAARVTFYEGTLAQTSVEQPFSLHFEKEANYLTAWEQYMQFERRKMNEIVDSCKPLQYTKFDVAYGKVIFTLKAGQTVEEWERYAQQITVECTVNGKPYRLGALRTISSNKMEVDVVIEDILERLPYDKNGTLHVSNTLEEVAQRRRDQALQKTKASMSVITDLGKYLANPATVEPFPQRTHSFPMANVPTLVNGKKADLQQEAAITAALNTNDLVLIQGPPGTGKTSVIQTIMKCLLQLNQKDILITSYQHLAVDNAMQGLTEQGVIAHRFGGQTYQQQLLKTYEQIVKRIVEPIQSRQIIEVPEKEFLEQLLIELQQFEANELTATHIQRLQHYVEEMMSDFDFPIVAFQSCQQLLSALPIIDDEPAAAFPTSLMHMYDTLPKKAATIQKREHIQAWQTFHQQMSKFMQQEQHASKLLKTLSTLRTKATLHKQNDEWLAQMDDVLQQLQRVYEQAMQQAQASEQTYDDVKEALRVCIVELHEALEQTTISFASKEEEILQHYAKALQANPLDVAEMMGRYAQVKGATCQQTVAQRHGMYDAIFDAVIIDEAARANPLDLLIPMTLGKKVILVGDHKQLPHILEPDFEKEQTIGKGQFDELYTYSLFERLYNGLPSSKKVMLKQQFRMHPQIGQLVSELFYPEGLTHGLSDGALPNESGVYDGHHVTWLDVAHALGGEEGRYRNKAEAEAVVTIVKQLLMDAKNIGKISVITFYSEQVTLLQQYLSNNGLAEQVELGTVDAFQGKENDIVILSTVRSNTYNKASRALGFLRSPNRFNVALSRARSLLIIVGDYKTLQQEHMFQQTYEYVKECGYVDQYRGAEHFS